MKRGELVTRLQARCHVSRFDQGAFVGGSRLKSGLRTFQISYTAVFRHVHPGRSSLRPILSVRVQRSRGTLVEGIAAGTDKSQGLWVLGVVCGEKRRKASRGDGSASVISPSRADAQIITSPLANRDEAIDPVLRGTTCP
jgi:hypothetical protein